MSEQKAFKRIELEQERLLSLIILYQNMYFLCTSEAAKEYYEQMGKGALRDLKKLKPVEDQKKQPVLEQVSNIY